MQKKFTVRNRMGIHARPATRLVQTANLFPCEIIIEKAGKRINGKNIMGIMAMTASYGDELTVIIHGDHEAKAMKAIGAIIESASEAE